MAFLTNVFLEALLELLYGIPFGQQESLNNSTKSIMSIRPKENVKSELRRLKLEQQHIQRRVRPVFRTHFILKSLSERVGSDIERLWNWILTHKRLKMAPFRFRVVRISIKSGRRWLRSGLFRMINPWYIQEFYEPIKRDAMDELTSLWSSDALKRSGADNSADLYYDSYSSF